MGCSIAYGPYFHGGVPGLQPGDELLPPRVTGNGEPRAWDADYIYVTRLPFIARMHAGRWPGGDVYRVAVEHVDGADPTVPWPTIWVARATVRAVVDRGWCEPAHFYASEAAMGAQPGCGKPGEEIRCMPLLPPRADLSTYEPIRRSDG